MAEAGTLEEGLRRVAATVLIARSPLTDRLDPPPVSIDLFPSKSVILACRKVDMLCSRRALEQG
jgi:hypothetical protein